MAERAGLAAFGDEHAADRVEVARFVAACVGDGGEERDRGCHVSYAVIAAALERDPGQGVRQWPTEADTG